MGTADEPPPGIQAFADDVLLRYAADRVALEREIVDADIVYTWRGHRERSASRMAVRA